MASATYIMSIRSLQPLLLTMLLVGCSDPQSPEAQVRAVIAGIQAGAEARDSSDVMQFVARDFRSAEGQGFDDLQKYLRGYFLTHQSIHLLTRIEQLEFPVAGEAKVRLSVGMAGKQGTGTGWNLNADVQQLELVLREEAGRWKVVHAARQRP